MYGEAPAETPKAGTLDTMGTTTSSVIAKDSAAAAYVTVLDDLAGTDPMKFGQLVRGLTVPDDTTAGLVLRHAVALHASTGSDEPLIAFAMRGLSQTTLQPFLDSPATQQTYRAALTAAACPTEYTIAAVEALTQPATSSRELTSRVTTAAAAYEVIKVRSSVEEALSILAPSLLASRKEHSTGEWFTEPAVDALVESVATDVFTEVAACPEKAYAARWWTPALTLVAGNVRALAKVKVLVPTGALTSTLREVLQVGPNPRALLPLLTYWLSIPYVADPSVSEVMRLDETRDLLANAALSPVHHQAVVDVLSHDKVQQYVRTWMLDDPQTWLPLAPHSLVDWREMNDLLESVDLSALSDELVRCLVERLRYVDPKGPSPAALRERVASDTRLQVALAASEALPVRSVPPVATGRVLSEILSWDPDIRSTAMLLMETMSSQSVADLESYARSVAHR